MQTSNRPHQVKPHSAAITLDADGNINESCPDLDPQLVWFGLALAIRNELPFMGKPHTYWQELIGAHAQLLADQADPEQFDDWGVASYA